MPTGFVERRGHEVVVTAGYLVHPYGGESSPVEQILCVQLVDGTDTGHHTGAVGATQSFADMDTDRFESAFLQHFGCRTPFAPVMHFSFADQAEGHMRQLYQVTTCADTAVFGNEGTDAAVDELRQEFDQFRMYAALALRERAHACEHGRAYKRV